MILTLPTFPKRFPTSGLLMMKSQLLTLPTPRIYHKTPDDEESSTFRISTFHISVFRFPGLLMMKSLDSSNSQYLKLSSYFRDFGVSHFMILGLLMMKSLDSSNSRYPKLSSCFQDFVTPLHLAL
jgi:hypothetical protein